MCSRGRLWPSTPGPGAPIQAAIGQHWHFVGDSLTGSLHWFRQATGANGEPDPPGNYFVDQLEAALGGAITYTESGIAGDRAVWVASQVHDRVALYNPDVVCIQLGLNDIRVGTSAAVIEAAWRSILFGIRAECPNAQIMVPGMFLMGEHWNSGPLRWAPDADHNITPANLGIAAAATTYGAAYVDWRDAALVYESLNNTPEPGVDLGLLTWLIDNFHPSPLGKVFMGDRAMLQVTT